MIYDGRCMTIMKTKGFFFFSFFLVFFDIQHPPPEKKWRMGYNMHFILFFISFLQFGGGRHMSPGQ
jgi:hypothetical protein